MAQKSTRSKIEGFRKEFISLARKGAGGYATIADRQRIGRYFLDHLKNTGIKLRSVDALKVRYVESYMEYRKSLNLSNRTLQNEMSVLRGILHAAGKHRLADPKNERLSNQVLGISGVNRDGTKTALTRDEFLKAFAEIEKKDRGVAATMRLAYVFGLRTKEAVEACKSLSTWKQAVERGDKSIRVVFGTKGGRPRDTTIIDRDEVRRAIRYAEKEATERKGKFIDKPSIHQAINRYRYFLRKAGLNGEKAPHSMRYNFARELSIYHKEKGFNDSEVLAMVSMDLGHGDGRGRYIKQVYYRHNDSGGE
ncbi:MULTISPECIES: integrase domain-containing protein [Yersinia]|uniref:DNA-binding protein n=1 Tax=Yersinia hibernica TaxID=2339259 RepID=A0ABX5R4H1_9GAMM|nr:MULTISPECIES: integrase domain-containing protein [Yersinia]PHZ22445.1 DNA-binding protein [Yersinia massiliensis]QAX80269.1 DNA-binding protein [Yersinia hibernica]